VIAEIVATSAIVDVLVTAFAGDETHPAP